MATYFGPGFFAPGSEGADGDRAARFTGRGGPRRIDVGQVADPQARQVIGDALAEAAHDGHRTVHVLHLLRALTRHDDSARMIAAVGAVPADLAATAARSLPAGGRAAGSPSISREAGAALSEALQIARALGAARIAPEHILFALVTDPGTPAGEVLAAAGVTPERLHAAVTGEQADPTAATPQDGGPGAQVPAPDSATPTLDRYGTDLTARARDGLIDPVIGRDTEVEQTVEILMRRRKNNPVLIGEAGVGKTAIAEGLARRIAEADVPEALAGTRVVALDLAGMLAGARYRGEFEERMTALLAELSAEQGRTLLFIDELHTIVGAGGAEGAVDAGNMLKPKLARGELHVIGATTLDEYRKHIEKDPALERRFQPVRVDEPSRDDALTILTGLRETYAEHHGVVYDDAALAAAVDLSVRYLPDRFLPDKAIDLIDQAGARRRLAAGAADPAARLAELTEAKEAAVAAEDYERAGALRDRIAALSEPDGDAGTEPIVISAEDVAEVVSRATGIPAGRMVESERARLLRLEDELAEHVIGQRDAVSAIARAVRRNRSGMADPGRPVGSFLFLGPTGVGKTELAKSLAGALFGDRDRMIRVDMSEFGERHTASRLVGAPPGYVGHDEAGQLTEQVRRNPYSVVLLDEMEKAHPDVFDLLLQVLDDGRLTDGQGRTVDFSNTVVIMTSNLGSELITARGSGLGFTSGTEAARAGSAEDLRKRLMGRLREAMRPEFVNRIDEIVVFDRLDADELRRVTDLLLGESRERLAAREIDIEIGDEVIDWLAERGYQPEFGARPLRRTIQRELDDRLADLLLADAVGAGDTVTVHLAADGELAVEVAGHRPPAAA